MENTFTGLRARLTARRNLPSPAIRRALRQGAGLSQRDLANAIGASRAAVGYWESGRDPHGKFLEKYAEALRILREAS